MKGKRMSIAQIKTKYKDEWLLLADYRLDDKNEPVSGVVIAHSKDRDEIYSKQMDIEKNLCIFYAGEMPQDLAIMF